MFFLSQDAYPMDNMALIEMSSMHYINMPKIVCKFIFFALKINFTPSIAERPQIQNYTTSWQKYFQKHTIQSCKILQIYVTVWEFGVKA